MLFRCDGASAFVDIYGMITNNCEDDCPHYLEKLDKAHGIEAVWCPRDGDGNTYASWLMQTKLPYSSFDIMEDGDLYCRGLVFCLADAKAKN